MKRALFVVVALASLAAACGGRTSAIAPIGTRSGSPFIIQQNGPSPSPWLFFPNGASYGTFVAGPDGKMWSAQCVYPNCFFNRVDPATLTVQQFPEPAGVLAGYLTAGPDGNVWFCSGNGVGYVTPQGAVTTFSGPIGECHGMTLGPDGNFWIADRFSGIVRATTSGVFTTFALPHPACETYAVVGGKSALVWFTEWCTSTWVGSYVGNINTTTAALQDWQIKNPVGRGHERELWTMSSGADGNAYAGDVNNSALVRVHPTGAYRVMFEHLFAGSNAQENVSVIWGGEGGALLTAFPVRGHTLTTYQLPSGYYMDGAPVLGTDENIWFGSGVYVMRLLYTTPSSAALTVGQQQPVTITEAKCKACIWSATSSDPSVATVSPVSGNQFTITAVGSGSASISVADKHQNVTDVALTVN